MSVTADDRPGSPVSGDTGDETDIEASYRRLWPSLVRLGRLLTGSQQYGEELAQEAFVGLLRSEHSIDNPAAYLRRSVVNLSINAGRRAKRERDYLARQRESVVLPADLDETWRHIVALPMRQRTVLVLRYYEDLSEQEIAAVMACRPGTVKSLAARALAQLRKDLS
jgi:RNA polymerase sigma factor (sigma-70 family)